MTDIYTYEQAAQYLGKKSDRPCGNNTRVQSQLGATGSDIGIRLHDTLVVVYHKDGSITVNTGGWHTVTTADRLERFGPSILRFNLRKGKIYVSLKEAYTDDYTHEPSPWSIIPLRDGMKFNQIGGIVA